MSMARSVLSQVLPGGIVLLLGFVVLGMLPGAALGPAHAVLGPPRAAPGAAPTAGPPANVLAFPTATAAAAGAPSMHLGAMPRLGHFSLPGPHPGAWGPSGVPPGAEALLAPQGWGGGGTGGSSNSTAWHNRFCAGLWPSFENVVGLSSQGAYASGCYGHDEPGIQFYSTLQGSGGNVSWAVTLPTDRDATHNQSDLYAAIWFGMTMTDPYAWMDQCFLELQFYPDQTFYNPGPLYPNWTVNGAWIGAAVAWQIDANGYEDPCFYEPLYLNGVPGYAFLNMTQGDHIDVSMTGWWNSPTGEQLSIIDRNSGQGSNLTLYNYYQGYPLNPSYVTSGTPASMQWTPGGEFPVSFAFETGHAGNPSWPYNNSYGGCSGGSVSTPTNPGAPCPSYDPGSWANDTRTPWHIATPTFFNGAAHDRPVQVAFTQPEGGIGLVDQTSNGACAGLEGSAWCSYPWYSYYCASHTFEFGALDYPGVASDFGKYSQFSGHVSFLPSGLGYFDPTNFSVPACAAGHASISVGPSAAGGGSVYFLHGDLGSPRTVGPLAFGNYSIHALASPGMGFAHWTTSGGVTVATGSSAYTSVHVGGAGSIRAVFTATPKLTKVTFRDTPKGSIGLDPSNVWSGTGAGLATIARGGTYSLGPGIYSIQAYPRPGYNFSYWTWSGGLSVPAPEFPFTQLVVRGTATAATLTAVYTASSTNGNAIFYVVGAGTASFGPLTVTSTSPYGYNVGTMSMAVGTYAITITPAVAGGAWALYYGNPFLISNNSATTFGTIENGTGYLEVVFPASAPVTFQASPKAGGQIYANTGTGYLALTSGTTVSLDLGTYEFVATPSPGYAFTGWVTKNASTLTFSTMALDTYLTVAGPGTALATFAKTTTRASPTFKVTPMKGGTVLYDLNATLTGGTTLSKIAAGEHFLLAQPAPGFSFAYWMTKGTAVLVGSAYEPDTVVQFLHGNGSVTAVYVPTEVPVTFILWNPHSTALPHGSVTIAGKLLLPGETIWLKPGSYNVTLHQKWPLATWSVSPAGGLSPSSSTSGSMVLTVASGGTLEAILA